MRKLAMDCFKIYKSRCQRVRGRGLQVFQYTMYSHGLSHLSRYAFSKNGRPTIVDKSGKRTSFGKGWKNTDALSDIDIRQFMKLYCGGVNPPTVKPTNPPTVKPTNPPTIKPVPPTGSPDECPGMGLCILSKEYLRKI